MKVTFDYLEEFERGAKALRKKYPSFVSDYDTFLNELEDNPFCGESLGQHTYKYRMAIASKGKGKSGGARVNTKPCPGLIKNPKRVPLYQNSLKSLVSELFRLSLVSLKREEVW